MPAQMLVAGMSGAWSMHRASLEPTVRLALAGTWIAIGGPPQSPRARWQGSSETAQTPAQSSLH